MENTEEKEDFMEVTRTHSKSIVFDILLSEQDVIDSLRVTPTLYFKNEYGRFEQVADIYASEVAQIRDLIMRKKKMKFASIFYERLMEVAFLRGTEIKILFYLCSKMQRNNWVHGVTQTQIEVFTRVSKRFVAPGLSSLIKKDFIRRVKTSNSYSYMVNPAFISRSSITSLPRLCFYYNKLSTREENNVSTNFINFEQENDD